MLTNTSQEPIPDVEPVACTLPRNESHAHLREWVGLQRLATEIRTIDGGVEMMLPASLIEEVEDLAGREEKCCSFLSIDTSVSDRDLHLQIRSENPDALPVIMALAGLSEQ